MAATLNMLQRPFCGMAVGPLHLVVSMADARAAFGPLVQATAQILPPLGVIAGISGLLLPDICTVIAFLDQCARL